MRIVMINIVDVALEVHPTVEPTLFVDDLSTEVSGHGDDVLIGEITAFTVMVCDRIAADGMEVSQTKSVCTANHPVLGNAVADMVSSKTSTNVSTPGTHIGFESKVKSLGLD